MEGHLDPERRAWFGDLTLHYEGTQTVLEGDLVDQPAVYGLIGKLRDLGLLLVEIRQIRAENAEDQDSPGDQHS